MKIQIVCALCALSLLACEEEAEPNTETPETVETPEPSEPATEPEAPATPEAVEEVHAVAILAPTEGNELTGRVDFTQTEEGVKVLVLVEGLEPESVHGFHIHETGDCSAPDGTSAGGHWNPEGHDHALPDGEDEGHAGDLGNLTADAQGNATAELMFAGFSLVEEPNALGKAVILHANPDDGSQPTGNAGPRIACAVIVEGTGDVAGAAPAATEVAAEDSE